MAHDDYIEFSIEGNTILYQGEESEIRAGKIRVEFIKSYRDNPKINGIVLMKVRAEDTRTISTLSRVPWRTGRSCPHCPSSQRRTKWQMISR